MSEGTLPPPQIKISWLVGVAAAFLIFSIIGNYSSRMSHDYPGYDEDRGEARKVTLAKVQAAENKLLYPVDAKSKSTAEWVDQDKGLVRISIDEAMSEEIDTLKAQPTAVGADIAPPAPAAPAPAAAPASTNAAPAKPAPPKK